MIHKLKKYNVITFLTSKEKKLLTINMLVGPLMTLKIVILLFLLVHIILIRILYCCTYGYGYFLVEICYLSPIHSLNYKYTNSIPNNFNIF